MIRINLLPSGKKKKTFMLPSVVLYGVIATVLIIITTIALTVYMNRQISSKQTEIVTKERKLKQLQAALVEVKNYERDNQEFREKTKIIEQLKKNQIIPLRLLDEVSEMLPKGVWLTNMQDKGGIVSIDGYAFTNSDLVAYVQNLKSSKHLTDVMLNESKQTEIGDFSVYKYKLTFKIQA